MFNTLNNIYSLAHQKSDKTAEVVARLSDIMRYFVHDAAKEKVSISTEINLIQGYIALEKIRMRNLLSLDFTINIPNHKILVPPMLFIPFVENYFKHGVDKTRYKNEAKIELNQINNRLHFRMQNKLPDRETSFNEGTGLNNIKKRLQILFDEKYTLEIKTQDGYFYVLLSIPTL
jgi:LytS/YehU family sensor histidine kinase